MKQKWPKMSSYLKSVREKNVERGTESKINKREEPGEN